MEIGALPRFGWTHISRPEAKVPEISKIHTTTASLNDDIQPHMSCEELLLSSFPACHHHARLPRGGLTVDFEPLPTLNRTLLIHRDRPAARIDRTSTTQRWSSATT